VQEDSFRFFKKVVEAPSPSGFEQPAQSVVREELAKFADEVKTDIHGNVIGIKNPGGDPRLMLAGHCDEIGFMIKYIDRNGFIFFSSIGGVDAHIVPGQRVKIHASGGPILGVVGKKPIHIMEEEERKKVVKLSEQWIDIGVTSKREAEKLVSVGDAITFSTGLERLQKDLVVSRGLDDKAGVFIICEVLRAVSDKSPSAAVFAAFTAQEEIGLRGARTAAYSINPKIGIAVDVDVATDYPSMDRRKEGDIRLGRGAVICRGPNINPFVEKKLIEIAKKENIPHQLSGESRATPTDANVIQISRSGVASALVSVPLRYLHTPGEVLCLKDVEAAIKLLTLFVLTVDNGMNLVPGGSS